MIDQGTSPVYTLCTCPEPAATVEDPGYPRTSPEHNKYTLCVCRGRSELNRWGCYDQCPRCHFRSLKKFTTCLNQNSGNFDDKESVEQNHKQFVHRRCRLFLSVTRPDKCVTVQLNWQNIKLTIRTKTTVEVTEESNTNKRPKTTTYIFFGHLQA